MTRMSYYGMSGLPGLVWQGTIQSSGAGSDAATGIPYRATIQGLLAEPSAFKLTVNSVDFTGPTGSIDIDIEVMEGGMDVSNMVLRMVLTEDGVAYGGDVYYDVTRDMIAEVPVTVDNLGEIQNANPTFTADPSWVESRLEIIAFLRALLARVDSSLIEEWENLVHPGASEPEETSIPERAPRRPGFR